MELTDQPWEVSDVPSRHGALCPSLSRLVAQQCPESQFHWLLLVAHCLMVESGFLAVDELSEPENYSETEPDVKKKQTKVHGLDSVPKDSLSQFDLPASVEQQLRQLHHRSSVSIRYVCRSRQLAGYALLKLVNEGSQVGCHCGLAASAGQPVSASSSRHFSLARYFSLQDATASGNQIRLLNMREMSATFKDRIALPARTALFELNGLTSPQPSLVRLPPELLLRILRHCDSCADVCRLGQACQLLAGLHRDNSIWRSLFRRHFSGAANDDQLGRLGQVGSGPNAWYEAYRLRHVERARRARIISRLGSREVSLLPSPLLLAAAAAAAAAALDSSFASARPAAGRGGSGRRSLQDLLLLPGGQEMSRLFGGRGGGGEVWSHRRDQLATDWDEEATSATSATASAATNAAALNLANHYWRFGLQ